MADIERITPSEAKRKLASVLNTVEFGHKSILLERRGRDIAALIPIELFALVRELLQDIEDEEDWKEIRRALADPENAVPLDWDSSRYGTVVRDTDTSLRPQKPVARAAAPPAKGARKHRRARH